MTTEVNLLTYREFIKEEPTDTPLVEFCEAQAYDDENVNERCRKQFSLIERADIENRYRMLNMSTKQWIYTSEALKKTLQTLRYATITIIEYEKILSPKMIKKVEDHALDHYKASKLIDEYKNATMQIEGLESKMIKESL